MRGHERPIVNRLTREHPYALFVFSNKGRTDWHFLNVKYEEEAEKRRLLRRITVRPGEGLRTATERMQMLDLEAISPDLLGLSPLVIQQQHDDAFDVEKVTKDFYREIANWYFWALKHVTFPKDAPKEKDGLDHISVIRLITRLIFCWFIREKGLIPDVLFDEAKLVGMLEGFTPGKTRNKGSVFYRAILQNLFFATLNTEMDQRGWRRADQNFMAHSLYRHKECFRDPKAGLDWFKDIPFLNGGLFECLDRDFGEEAKPRYLRVDGFSDRDDSRPIVPDFLFFGSEQNVDLSGDYGDKKFKCVRVRGLIDTLNRYKFTIEENTPLDQEVALDPEMCGKVFENLLAAYNPETGTTARKATGSFYTPREIVDYMVDESLAAYLKGKLTGKATEDTDQALRHLLAYDGEPHGFDRKATEELIDAIDSLKALDPAVGSGAFPMGILHKLVHVLGKLDPDNERWKAKQIAKLDDVIMREDAERVFRENYDDYGRKLYLIENCIYGVDIQPIAVQIAKMRFFISLIVDQKVNPKAPNLGVRALPNLETKFVAANTLIGIDRPAQMMLRNPDIDKKEEELRNVRDKHFTAKTLKAKAKCRDDDKRLRSVIAELLKNDGWDNATAKQLAAWDPYDQNTHADFFDSEWMFGLTDGLDVVLGNPPYGAALSKPFRTWARTHYQTAKGELDSYMLFVEKSMNLLRPAGLLAFILPDTWLTLINGERFRRWVLTDNEVTHLAILNGLVFHGSVVDTMLLFLAKQQPAETSPTRIVVAEKDKQVTSVADLPLIASVNQMKWLDAPQAQVRVFSTPALEGLLERLWAVSVRLDTLVEYRAGCKPYEKGKGKPPQTEETLKTKPFTAPKKRQNSWMPLLRGNDIHRFSVAPRKPEWIHYGKWLAAPRTMEVFSGPRILIQAIRNPSLKDRILCARSDKTFITRINVYSLLQKRATNVDLNALVALLNSQLMNWLLCKEYGLHTYVITGVLALPIHRAMLDPKDSTDKTLAKLSRQITAAKEKDQSADTSALEQEINERVYKLYGLTAEEIKTVQGASQE
ncbi:Eco57I restriction-modification methylase domain-containing protein [Verrucomicrobiota bacterium]